MLTAWIFSASIDLAERGAQEVGDALEGDVAAHHRGLLLLQVDQLHVVVHAASIIRGGAAQQGRRSLL